MKKFLMFFITVFVLSFTCVYATEINDNTSIPEMSFEDLFRMMQSRQGKVDIIKKNNQEIASLKESLKKRIVEAATRVNELKIEVYKDNDVAITTDTIEELKSLLNFLQESKKTLEEDVDKISNEIEGILDLISTKGMQLDQYDLLIEKQNEVIIEMKNIMQGVSMI